MSLQPSTLPPVQDMPPPGGFAKVDLARVIPKRGPKGWQLWLGTTLIVGYGFAMVAKTNKQKAVQNLEDRRIRYAISPLLQAEADREYLQRQDKLLKREAEVMANVKGWKVGESVYFSEKKRFRDIHKDC